MNLRAPAIVLFGVLTFYGLGWAFDDSTLFVLGAIISAGMAVLIGLSMERDESE